MTGFDETVPPDDGPARDENSVGNDWPQVRPEHDEAVPALVDDPEPDEPGGEQQPKPSGDLAQDDELRAGQYGPTADHA